MIYVALYFLAGICGGVVVVSAMERTNKKDGFQGWEKWEMQAVSVFLLFFWPLALVSAVVGVVGWMLSHLVYGIVRFFVDKLK